MDNFTEIITCNESQLGSDDEFDMESIDEDLNIENSENWIESDFSPQLHEFECNPRIVIAHGERIKPIDYFQHFFDEDLVNVIVQETNRFQSQNPIYQREKMAKWKNITVNELYVFLGIILLTGIIGKRKIRDYWSTNMMINTPFIPKLMSRNRFQDILRCLHFNNNEEQQINRLSKLKFVIDYLKRKFKFCIVPGKKLCIDESLLLWKGKLAFKQYIPSKKNRFGIKIFILADCNTKVILDFIIYTGKETEIDLKKELGISGSIVKTLLQHYLDKGHVLYVDNWYSSPTLFNYLHSRSTGCVGTVRKNRKGLPKLDKRLKKGEIESKNTSNLLYFKWMDKREVYMLTTMHKRAISDSGKKDRNDQPIMKPTAILDYNLNMGAIDQIDMQISFTESVRKTVKWYKKVFFHLLDLSIFNSYAIYSSTKQRKMPLHDFRMQILEDLFAKYGSFITEQTGRPSTSAPPLRLTERHFPDVFDEKEQSGRNQRKVCHICKLKTRFYCADCQTTLCVPLCFRNFHTKLHYSV